MKNLIRVIWLFVGVFFLCATSVSASTYNVYDGNFSSSNATFFANFDIGVFDDYVIWRDTDYSYKMFVSDSLSVSGTTFTADSGRLYNYYSSGQYNTYYHYVSSDETNFVLNNPNHYIIYSSIGTFPKVDRGLRYDKILLFTLITASVFALIGIIFKCVNVMPFGSKGSR